MRGLFITLCTVVIFCIGAIAYCYNSNEAKAIEYRNELISAISRTTGDDWDVIEVRGEQMTVKYAQNIIDYIELNY